MAAGTAPDGHHPLSEAPATAGPAVALPGAEGLAHPTGGMVLHRVLATSARTFLVNDLDAEPTAEPAWHEAVDSLSVRTGTRPLWARTTTTSPEQTNRRRDETERIHQSRVAMRRIRSNLRTFRLLVDATWGTALRGELAWYGRCLGESRDLHIIRDIVATKGPDVIEAADILHIQSVVSARLADVMADIAAQRGGARRFQLTEQMMLLWEGPSFKPKANRAADEVLPPMLRRTWHDVRGAARRARKDTTARTLHALRIRMKNLRYGCETVALIDGGPARKTARAAERMQVKLGDYLDATSSIEWFGQLARERTDLAEPLGRLQEVQRATAAATRKGWKRELKEVERSWRRWQG